MKLTVRDLVYIGVFGACWGAAEVTLGALLHAMRVPFLGALMAGIGMSIALVGRLYVPRPGAVVLMAVVTALVRLLSVGGFMLSPMVAIVMEGLLADVCLRVFGVRLRGFVVAAGLACLYPLVHSIGSTWITGGQGFVASYLSILAKGARLLGLDPSWIGVVFATLAGIHLAVGATSGVLAWRMGLALRRRGRAWNEVAP